MSFGGKASRQSHPMCTKRLSYGCTSTHVAGISRYLGAQLQRQWKFFSMVSLVPSSAAPMPAAGRSQGAEDDGRAVERSSTGARSMPRGQPEAGWLPPCHSLADAAPVGLIPSTACDLTGGFGSSQTIYAPMNTYDGSVRCATKTLSVGRLIPVVEMQLNTALETSNSRWALFRGQRCFRRCRLFYLLPRTGSVRPGHLYEIPGFQLKTHPSLWGFVFLCGTVDTDANRRPFINAADQRSYLICLARHTDNHLGYARKSSMHLTANASLPSIVDTNRKASHHHGVNLSVSRQPDVLHLGGFHKA